MTAGLWVVIAAVVVALGFGLWRRANDGRFGAAEQRGLDPLVGGAPHGSRTGTGARAAEPPGEESRAPLASPLDPSILTGTAWQGQLGGRATLLQFSSAFCAPCRATRTVLSQVAERHDGITHVEVDAEEHLDLVRRLRITRTPTTLVLDASGRELGRAAGAPTRAQVEASLPA